MFSPYDANFISVIAAQPPSAKPAGRRPGALPTLAEADAILADLVVRWATAGAP
ncbi:MAG TPA: hypothetical protein PLW65_34475 [Pseudomonadota bacterium]|nr:hypothetical protein [Pseudomonadota bacterium]